MRDDKIIELPDSVSFERMQDYALDHLQDKACLKVEQGKCGEYNVEHLFSWRGANYLIKADIHWNRAEYVYWFVDGGKITSCVKI